MYDVSDSDSCCSDLSCAATVWGASSDVALHEYLGDVDRSVGRESSSLHDEWLLAGKGGDLKSYFHNIDNIPNPPNAPAMKFPPENIYEGYEKADEVTLRRMVEQAQFQQTCFQGELQARNEDLLNRDKRIKRLIKQKAKRFKPLQTANFQEMLQSRNTLDKANMSLDEAKRELDKMEHAFVHLKLRYAQILSSEDELKLKVEFYEAALREQDESFVPYNPVENPKPSVVMAKRRKDFLSMWRSLGTKKAKRDTATKIGQRDSLKQTHSAASNDDGITSNLGTPSIQHSSLPLILPPSYQDKEAYWSPEESLDTVATPGAEDKSGKRKAGRSYFGKPLSNALFMQRRHTYAGLPNAMSSPVPAVKRTESIGAGHMKEDVRVDKEDEETLMHDSNAHEKMPEEQCRKSFKETMRTIIANRRWSANSPANSAYHGESVFDS